MDLRQLWIERLPDGIPVEIDVAGEPVRELLCASVPDGADFEVQAESFVLRRGSDFGLEFAVKLLFPGVPQAGAVTWYAETEEGEAKLDYVYLPPSKRRQKIGRMIVRRGAELFRKLGFTEMTLEAERFGRYSWALCGFDFYDSDERDRVVRKAEAFAKSLGAPQDLRSVKHSWQLAALAGTTTRGAMAAARGEASAGDVSAPVELGRALLLGPTGNEWAGRLDLRESVSYDIMRRYTSR